MFLEKGVNMFGFLEDVVKTVSAAVTVPVGIVADVVTMGGQLSDKDKPYTAEAVEDFMKNLSNIAKPRS
jgi:hypothetical protein